MGTPLDENGPERAAPLTGQFDKNDTQAQHSENGEQSQQRNGAVEINFAEAQAFLEALSGDDWDSEVFAWQTIDDNRDRKLPAQVENGTFLDFLGFLETKNRQGFGVFVTVNKTDGRGRKAENIETLRAIWCEWDDPDAPMPDWPILPHLVVRTSPGKYHIYWFTEPLSVAAFNGAMACIVKMGSDPDAKDRSRVLRLPGFYHQKKCAAKGQTGAPHMVCIVARNDMPRYSEADISEAFPAPAPRTKPNGHDHSSGQVDWLVVEDALHFVPASERDVWLTIGMALHSTSDERGRMLWDEWSRKDSKFDPDDQDAKWESFTARDDGISIATLYHVAKQYGYELPRREPQGDPVRIEDFVCYLPKNSYTFLPTRQDWVKEGIDRAIPATFTNKKAIPASTAIAQENKVHQMTWAPGEDTFIVDRLVTEGGEWIPRSGVRCLNLYLPPSTSHGNASRASRWVDHVAHVYPDDAGHIIDWCAHRVQKPGEKINHALILGGQPGIGKDTLLEPVKNAVGARNFADVSPINIVGRFNGFLKSTVLRVSELRDLGDTSRYGFYEHMKTLTAAPPDVLLVDEKNRGEYYVMNCCGVVMTTNHKSGGIYLPANDRRHYVAWSSLNEQDFTKKYWDGLWKWYEDEGGFEDVAAFLAERDLSNFNPKASPRKTPAF